MSTGRLAVIHGPVPWHGHTLRSGACPSRDDGDAVVPGPAGNPGVDARVPDEHEDMAPSWSDYLFENFAELDMVGMRAKL